MSNKNERERERGDVVKMLIKNDADVNAVQKEMQRQRFMSRLDVDMLTF